MFGYDSRMTADQCAFADQLGTVDRKMQEWAVNRMLSGDTADKVRADLRAYAEYARPAAASVEG